MSYVKYENYMLTWGGVEGTPDVLALNLSKINLCSLFILKRTQVGPIGRKKVMLLALLLFQLHFETTWQRSLPIKCLSQDSIHKHSLNTT